MDELHAEWAQAAVEVCAALGTRRLPVQIVHDVLTHEADLREAFGLDPVPADDLDVALDHLAGRVCAGVRGPGTLVVRAGGREWRAGMARRALRRRAARVRPARRRPART